MIIAFWNICHKNLVDEIEELCKCNNIDIVCIAENPEGEYLVPGYNLVKSIGKLKIFSRYSLEIVNLLIESERYTILSVENPFIKKIIIAFCHLIPKVNYSMESKLIESQILSKTINDISEIKENRNVLISGDFNLNPFDSPMISAGGFHSTNDPEIAKKGSRVVQGKQYMYYYNPMWTFYGNTKRPFGTFFYYSSDYCVLNWEILDNYLLSSDLVQYYKRVELIEYIDGKNLLHNDGRINRDDYSDHLPVLLELTV
jgi:exonuclease III